MSREPSGPRVARVLRGGRATTATALAFPTIDDADRVFDGGTPGAPPTAGATPFGGVVEDCSPTIDEQELERLRLDAAARGYQDGYAAGRDEATQQIRQHAAAVLERLEAAIGTIESRRQATLDALTTDVAAFAFATVEALLDRELQLAASPARDAIERALRLTPDRMHAVVRLNPADVELVGPVEDFAGGRSVEVSVDATVEPGGCVVRADDCEVDAQLGPALQRLRTVLHLDRGARS